MCGDPRLAAIEAVYDGRLDDFVRTAAAIAGGREAGRDAVHDAFVTAIRTRAQFRGEGTLEAWLWKVVVSSALKARRQARLRGRLDRLEPESAHANGHAEHGAAQRAIALLPERQRLIVFLRYYADLDYQQIADTLGLRRGTVSAALHAAHGTLRKQLMEMEVPER